MKRLSSLFKNILVLLVIYLGTKIIVAHQPQKEFAVESPVEQEASSSWTLSKWTSWFHKEQKEAVGDSHDDNEVVREIYKKVSADVTKKNLNSKLNHEKQVTQKNASPKKLQIAKVESEVTETEKSARPYDVAKLYMGQRSIQSVDSAQKNQKSIPSTIKQLETKTVMQFDGNHILRTSGNRIRVGAPEYSLLAPKIAEFRESGKIESVEISTSTKVDPVKISTLSAFFQSQYNWPVNLKKDDMAHQENPDEIMITVISKPRP